MQEDRHRLERDVGRQGDPGDSGDVESNFRSKHQQREHEPNIRHTVEKHERTSQGLATRRR
jgi:hypothetical protein